MGKPQLTKYELNIKPRFDEIKKWVEDGWTDDQIAKEVDVHPWTLYDYRRKHPEFAKLMERSTKWDTLVQPRLQEIQQWCMEGITNDVICQRLGLSEATWYEYMDKHQVLADLVKWSKSVMDSRVENALLKAALGFEFEEIKTIVEEDKNGKKKTRIEKVKRYQPPNATAMIFWLKNRKHDEWNDRREFILDTKENEEARKQLFLEMIEEDIVDADYKLIEDNSFEDTEA